jgi:hypothetical protein
VAARADRRGGPVTNFLVALAIFAAFATGYGKPVTRR